MWIASITCGLGLVLGFLGGFITASFFTASKRADDMYNILKDEDNKNPTIRKEK